MTDELSSQIKISFFHWIAKNSTNFPNPEGYLYAFIEFLNANGLQIKRVSVGGSALHPEIEAFGYTFIDDEQSNRIDTFPEENPLLISRITVSYPEGSIIKMRFRAGVRMSEAFKNSPIPVLWTTKQPLYIPIDPATESKYPIIEDLKNLGATAYYAKPILLEQGIQYYLSLSSNKEGGFHSKELELVSDILDIFAIGWLQFNQKEMMHSLLSLYLGPMTGPQVLAGKIRRGDVETKEAIIWFSDIRDYTSISSNHPTKDVIEWLNDYYQAQISNIHKFGGEVLKIMGDGMLAIFPTDENKNIKTMARRAIRSVYHSKELLKLQNSNRKERGLPILSHGIALHQGKVEYGNIGSQDRLDFTIIGSDVNLTARLCAKCSDYKKDFLLSETFAKLVGRHSELVDKDVKIKGLKNSENIYSLKLD